MRTEGIDKWVRGRLNATVVVDTRRPLLFWEDTFPVPSYAIEPADTRTDLLRETDPPPDGPWSFSGPPLEADLPAITSRDESPPRVP